MFTKKLCVIQHLTTRSLIGGDEPRRGVHYLQDKSTRIVQANKVYSYETWHNWLGHPSSQALSQLSSGTQVELDRKKDTLCDVCLRAKQTRSSFPISNNNALQNFDLIHCDIWGGYRVSAFCGARCSLSIIDDTSRGVWVYLMKNKSETSQLIQNFCHMVHTQFNTKVKVLRSDNSNEFSSRSMKKVYAGHGILHQTSCVDTLQ